MNTAAILDACNKGQNLYQIANAGGTCLTDALEFLKKHFKQLSDDGQDNYGAIEWDADADKHLRRDLEDEAALENDGETYEEHMQRECAQWRFV